MRVGEPLADVGAEVPAPVRPSFFTPRCSRSLARRCSLRTIWRVTRCRGRVHAPRRGPKNAWTDVALTEQIRSVLARFPFVGERYRKVWARLCLGGVRTSKGRVLRLMRKAGLLALTRVGRRWGPRAHDGTITTGRPDEMWSTDATACFTTGEGNATVFVAVRRIFDRPLRAGVRRHPRGAPGHAFAALEPLHQGLRGRYGSYRAGIAVGLSLRHDHGSQYLGDHFQGRDPLLGHQIEPVVRGGARRRWLRLALLAFEDRHNRRRLMERHGHRTPAAVREALRSTTSVAA